MEVFKRFMRSVYGVFVLSTMLAIAVCSAPAAADDPLKGNYAVIDKEIAAVVAINGGSSVFWDLTGANPPGLPTSPGSGTNWEPKLGSAITWGSSIAAVASVAGDVADPDTNPENSIYGITVARGAVVAVAYLVNTSTAGLYDIWFTILDKDGSMLKPANAFVMQKGVRVATISKDCAYFSLVANDWNKDGYSDYILTYPTFSGTVGDSGSSGTYAISSVYVDGLTCYDSAKAHPNSNPTIGVEHQIDSGTSTGSASFGVSTAVGDVNGDGKKEFILFYSGYYAAYANNNWLDIFSITPQSGSSDAKFTRTLHTGNNVGANSLGNALAVAAGDFNGDGKDEIAAIYSNATEMRLAISVGGASPYPYSAMLDHSTDNPSRLTALAADLDGDGKDELIWDYLDPDSVNTPNLHIHTWPGGFASNSTTDPGNRYNFSIGNFDPVGRSLTVMRWSKSPFETETWLAYGYSDWGGSNTGLLEMVPAESFKSGGSWRTNGGTGTRYYSHFPAADHVALTGVNLYDWSMILGEPTEFTITANVKPSAIIQAPPKHWDVVSDGKGGSVTADAFAMLTASGALNGYEVDFSSTATDKTVTTTTSSDSFSLGEQASVTVTIGTPLVEDAIKAGVNAAQSSMEEGTDTTTTTTTVSFTTAAHDDDQLYYTETDYTMWRYPILKPVQSRYSSDGNQRFIQFIVPTYVNNSAFSTPGRNVSWYQPLFDTYNLFTWPRVLSQSAGYPSVNNKPDGSGTSWTNLNGKLLFSFGDKLLIGNGDKQTLTSQQASGVTTTDKTESKSTVSVTESDTLKTEAFFVNGDATVGMSEDWAWSSATIGTTDVSNTQSITLFWPGGANYKSPGGFTLEDQQFYVSGGVYTQDDGTLRVSFAVPQLQNRMGSTLWGGTSPYWTTPDPGLLLPQRYTWSGGALVANPALNANQIRGVDFSAYEYNVLHEYNVLPTDTAQTVTFRVFNYSFVNAPGFGYDVYYQTATSDTDLPDISKAKKVASGSVPAILGRDNTSAKDNWENAQFVWTTPSTSGSGYLHIALNPGSPQLSTSNDVGYVEVGICNASDLAGAMSAKGANAKGANALAARAKLETAGARLSIESTIVSDDQGNEIQGQIPLDKPITISTTVRLDGLPGSGLPLVKVNLYVDGVPVGSKHIPYLANGQRRTITFDYNPSDHAGVTALKSLGVRVFSEATGFKRDGEDSLSGVKEIEFAARDNKGKGGSGCCDAGFVSGALFLALLGAFAPRALLKPRKH
jgi:hypothetical protein